MKKYNSTLESSAKLINELYQVGLCTVNDRSEAESFSKNNMISSIQMIFSADALLAMRSSIDHHIIYTLTDPFFLTIMIFMLQDNFYVFGPFAPILQSKQHAIHIIKESGVTGLSVDDYLRYREHFPNLSVESAQHIVNSFIKICDPDSKSYKIRKQEDFIIETTDNTSETSREDQINLLQLRYANEQEFINSVENGDSNSALKYLDKMQRDVQYMKEVGSTIENERIACAITRTTLRMCAAKKGLPAYLIDQLSGQNTREVSNETRIDKILASKEKMVRNFCNAIDQYNTNKYSAIIYNAIIYLNNNFSKELNIDNICEELSISRSYLMTLFKKEIGTSPINYLRSIRIKKACNYLTGTKMSIQEISESVGIPDSNYFVKCFRKEKGQTPSEYRKKHRSPVKKQF